jgi:hypothetical protein
MWPFSEMSLSTASLVGTIANWGLLISLLTGLFSTFVIVKTADVKEEHWAHDRQDSNERIAQLNTGAARLSAEAESAKGEIAKANQGAAEANARAAEAQLALEKFKQPRLIPDLRVFGGRLKKFAKTRFDMSVIPGDPEAAVLMSRIAASLEEAGWTWVAYSPPDGALMMVFNMPGKPNIGQEGWRGVSVQVPDEMAELSPAANAIAGELMAVGIEATRDKAATVIPNKDTVHILVGKKPT